MSQFQVEVRVTPRPGLLDPPGQATHNALTSLGFEGVNEVRMGKVLYMEVEAESADAARSEADVMCRKLLANPVTEDFMIEVVEGAGGGGAS